MSTSISQEWAGSAAVLVREPCTFPPAQACVHMCAHVCAHVYMYDVHILSTTGNEEPGVTLDNVQIALSGQGLWRKCPKL